MTGAGAATEGGAARASGVPSRGDRDIDLILLALITAGALLVRLRGAPGLWDADSYRYLQFVEGGEVGSDPRSQRMWFIALVRAAFHAGGSEPSWASAPGIAFSVAAVPALWFALRRVAGRAGAVLAAALWAVLPLDLHESVKVTADVLLALPVAAALALLVAASRCDGAARMLRLAGCGVCLAAGVMLKENLVHGVPAFCVAALWIGRGRPWDVSRVRSAAMVGAAAVVSLAVLVGAFQPDRVKFASGHVAEVAWAIPFGSPEFWPRVTTAVPKLLLTSKGDFGHLFVAALPLLVRLPFRAWRGDLVAALAIAAVVAFDVLPASLSRWTLLQVDGRFAFWIFPPLLAAVACAAADDEADARGGRVERIGAALAATAALAIGAWDTPGIVVAKAGALLFGVSALRGLVVPPRVAETSRVVGACSLVLAAAAPRLPDVGWTGVVLLAAAAAGVHVALARRSAASDPVMRGVAVPVVALAVVAGVVAAARPWGSWNVTEHLPAHGVVLVDPWTTRLVRVARLSRPDLGFTATEVPWDIAHSAPLPPAVIAVAAPHGSLDARLSAPDSGWRVVAVVGEERLYVPSR